MHRSRLYLLNWEKSNTLTRRDIRNTTSEEQDRAHTDGRKAHRDGRSHNSTESQITSRNESAPQKNSSQKNEHSQAASIRNNNQTVSADHLKQQRGNSTSDQTSSDVHSAGAESDYSASTSSSSPPSNSSDAASILSSKIEEFIHNNQTASNHTSNSNYTWSSSTNIPATTSSTNPSSLEQHPLPNVDQNPHDAHHYKIKVWCIGIGSLLAFICIGTAIIFIKKRFKIKGPAAFLRRRFRSNSSDSNRAVRDRRSIGPHFCTSDPFSSPSTFSRKPLVLRPESISYIHSSSPGRPSILHLRNQSLKSQISPPIIEPPSPANYQPLSGDSPNKARRSASSSSNQISSQSINPSPPSYQQPREYPQSLPKHRPSISLTQDLGIRRGSMFSPKAYDPLTERTPVPPRPPRPDFSLLPPSSAGTNSLSKPIGDVEPFFPCVPPLRVPHRSQYANNCHRRQNSIDQVILDHPTSYAYQDSPTLPQFQGQERNSVLSMARGSDPARVSNLSRSTCYSQSSEQENFSVLEENLHVDSENHQMPLRFMSFGTSQSSSKLEQQLESFISKNM